MLVINNINKSVTSSRRKKINFKDKKDSAFHKGAKFVLTCFWSARLAAVSLVSIYVSVRSFVRSSVTKNFQGAPSLVAYISLF